MRPEKPREKFKEAYRRLLRPLIRILLRNGISAPEVNDLVKHAFVDAASSDEFRLHGRPISETRIAILTGLSRREVQRLRSGSTSTDSGSNLSRIGRLIAAWNQDPEFTGPYGLPRALPYESPGGASGTSFVALAKKHAGDFPPSELLDELVRSALAKVDDDGLIRNSGRTYIPSSLDSAAIERLGQVIGRLADTLDYNSQVNEAVLKRFERDVTTDIGLTNEQYRRFSVYLKDKCQELLETVDNWLANQEGRIRAQQDPDSRPTKKLVTGIGIYQYLDEEITGILGQTQDGLSENEDDNTE